MPKRQYAILRSKAITLLQKGEFLTDFLAKLEDTKSRGQIGQICIVTFREFGNRTHKHWVINAIPGVNIKQLAQAAEAIIKVSSYPVKVIAGDIDLTRHEPATAREIEFYFLGLEDGCHNGTKATSPVLYD